MQAILTVGVSASGKTTWADAQTDFTVISRDTVRRQILESKLNRPLVAGELWQKWKWKDEDEVTSIVQLTIRDAAMRGKNIILADTNLVKKYRDLAISKLQDLGYSTEIKLFPISYEEAIRRDNGRADGVGSSVIMKQWLQYQAEFGIEKYTPNKNLPMAVICDIDGTCAHMKGRGPFDWDKVDTDEVDEDVRDILNMYYDMGYKIVMLSGRDAVCRAKTESWLFDNGIPYDALFMRKEADLRKDYFVKQDLFNAHVADVYNVKLVIDDRPQCLRLWHCLGLKVLAVGNPYIEF